MKVYCKNCKWCHCEVIPTACADPSSYSRCTRKDRVITDCVGHRVKIGPEQALCANSNRDFACRHYVRKWWKFWIKKTKERRDDD